MKTLKFVYYPLSLLMPLLAIIVTTPANSQPITPGNDNTNTTVTPNGNQFDIQGGTRNGQNLFHSFDKFNVYSGQTANFHTTPDTRNILGRVTGGNASIINGLIQVIGGNSNLFLMNPTGMIFGPNASLNVPASFSVTTATGIGFNNNNYWFKAMGTNDYSSLVGNPSGYRFDVSNPGAIVNQGNLRLNSGENLTLLGGMVIDTGQLSTPGGNVTIAAVEGGTTLRISQPGNLLSLEVDQGIGSGQYSALTALSLPQLLTGLGETHATGITVNTNGEVVLTNSNTLVDETPGTAITSGNIDVSILPLSEIAQGGYNTGGNVNLFGDRVAVINANIKADGLNGGGTILIGGDFQGNGIVPNSQYTFVNDNSFISADAITNGDGGRVIIWSDGITDFTGNISAKGGGFSGDGGFVEVSGKQQFIFDGNVNVSSDLGNPGTILLDPENLSVGEENSETEGNNSEVGATENSDSLDKRENADLEIEIGANNSEVAATENADSLTTEISDNSPTTENTNSETTEIPIDPFAQDENADVTISAENLGELSGDIILQADNDITINEKIETDSSVELKAGRSIEINADIDTSVGNGNIDLFGNNDEMNLANRSQGKGSINQLDGTTLNAGSGTINIELGNLGEVGDINLANLTTTGRVLVNANRGNITRVSDNSIINGGSVLFQTSEDGGIGSSIEPMQLNVENLEGVSGSGGVFFDVGDVNVGGVSEDVNGIVTAGGDIEINSEGNLTLTETISTINNNNTGGSIHIETTGNITTTGQGIQSNGENISLSATNISLADEFDSASGDTDINLRATNDITIKDIAGDTLEFLPGDGAIAFRADIDGDGVGIVQMLDNLPDVGSAPNTLTNGADTIKTNGRNLTIAGASISLGNIDTFSISGDGGAISLNAEGDIRTTLLNSFSLIQGANGGDISLNAGDNITTTSLNSSSGIQGGDGGTISLNAGNNITTTSFDSSSDILGGNGGTISLNAGNNITTTSFDSSSNILGGDGGTISLNAGNNITTKSFDSSSKTNGGDAGEISLNADRNITTTLVNSSSNGDGDGGAISWDAGGNITTTLVNSSSNGDGDGGAISWDAGGDITTILVNSSSFSVNSYSLSNGKSGDGGNITLTAQGNIYIESLNTSSLSSLGNSGDGGDITLTTQGNINTNSLNTSSLSSLGDSGDGGNITLSAQGDINLTAELVFNIRTEKGNLILINNDNVQMRTPEGNLILIDEKDIIRVNGDRITIQENEIVVEGDIRILIQEDKITVKRGIDRLEVDDQVLLDSFSFSREGDSGNGGTISLNADRININSLNEQQPLIRTFSIGQNNSEKGGDVNITTNNLSNTEILTLSSFSESGKVLVEGQPQGNLELNDLSIITGQQVMIQLPFQLPFREAIQIDVDTQGKSGDVSIISSGNLNFNNVTIESDTNSNQDAGNVNITSIGNITLDSTNIFSTTNAQGRAGEISLEATENVLLTNNSKLQASTEDAGNAGTIKIQANNLNLDQNTSLITETISAGNPGSISIQANTVDIGEDAQISATVVTGSTSTGEGGNITINTNELNITGKLGIFAETEAIANAGILTLSPYKNNPDLDINFRNDGFISASTSSTGNGGNIFISAPENINISGAGFIAVETSGAGNAGIIEFQTENLTISNGVAISASTEDQGNAGEIHINTREFTLEKGTSLTTETNSAGIAGDIEIKTQQLTIGENAQVSATSKKGASNTEAGGNIIINANELLISGKLGIFAETAGESPAGTLTLNPYRNNPNLNITFTEQGFISARTTSTGDGGNINIFAPENINISGDGFISVETTGVGNAGIINIETENLTIAENTTISAATSDSGEGGSININSNQTFQLEGEILTETTGTGNGGTITINVGEMTAPNSTISAKSTDAGNAGTIDITAQENITTGIITSQANNTTETADGGNITITSEQGGINATQAIQSFSEGANAGDVTVTAQNDITTNTISSHGQQQGGQITITSETGNIDTSNGDFIANYSGGGDAGNLNLTAPEGNITTNNIYSFAEVDGGQITMKAGGDINITENSNIISASEPPSNSSSDRQGKGGDIILEAGNQINTTTARIFSGANIGNTGKVEIIADGEIETGQIDLASGFVRDRVTVNDNFTLIPIPEGEATQGVAGDITVRSNNSTIDTTAGRINSRSPDGTGNITLNARENISTGKLEASALNDSKPTTGGNVSITSLQGEINATQGIETFSKQGTAGNVSIIAEGQINIDAIRSEGMEQGGNITINSRSENSIDAAGALNTYSEAGRAGDVTVISPGSINISSIRSEGMEQGGDIKVESEIGEINSTGDIDSYSDQGTGGNVEVNAPESVTLANVSSFGMTESGDLRIQSRTATVNTGNVTTQAPAGSSGNIVINGEEVGTGNLSSIGTTSAGEVNVVATDGSITTYDIEITSEGSIGSLTLRSSDDTTTEEISQNAGEGDANINIESGGDQNIGNIDQTAEAGNTNNIQTAEGDQNIGNVTQTAGGDTNNIQTAGGEQNIGNVTQTAGGDTNNIQTAGGEQNIGNVTQTAGGDTNNIQTAGGEQNIGNVTQTAGGDTNNIQTAGGEQNIGNVTQTARGDTNNIQTAGGEQNLGQINQTFGNESINIQRPRINQNPDNTSVNSNNNTPRINPIQNPENFPNSINIPRINPIQNRENFPNSINIPRINPIQNRGNSPVNSNNNTPRINPIQNPENFPNNNNTNIPNNFTNNNNNNPTINPSPPSGRNFLSNLTRSNSISVATPSNNNQTTNTPIAQHQKQESINHTTHTQKILKRMNTVNTNPLTVATGSNQVVTILEQNRSKEYSDYLGTDFQEQFLETKNVRDVLSDMSSQTGKESAVVYINAYPEQLQIILYTKDKRPIIKIIPESNRKEVMEVVLELGAQIRNPTNRHTDNYLLPAQKLYDWLIAPISAELEAANIETLLFSMDEGLRTLPVAVLHNGEQFLVEKYSLSLIPSMSLMDTKYRPLQDTNVLAMGASKFIEQQPLPAVPVEIQTISKKLWQGNMFLNEDFTRDNLVSQRQDYPYPIIHLATHAEFKPGKASNSYIQLWGNEQIKLDQVRELGWSQPAVELLVLSACRTAFGDKNAELGFAGLAVAAGVKSALASIWYVSDEGTLGLMTEFYTHLNNAKIKAEALRQAQLAMLRGKVVIVDGRLRGSQARGTVDLPSALGELGTQDLSHPYYWAGFTMVGSPW